MAHYRGGPICGLASFFIPGLGQLINGRVFSAIFWFLLVAIILSGLTAITGGIGLILQVPFWIWCIVDASK